MNETLDTTSFKKAILQLENSLAYYHSDVVQREACDRGLLISDLVAWKRYRQDCGTTSHTYDPEKAVEIFDEIPGFLKEAKYLLVQLESRCGEKRYA